MQPYLNLARLLETVSREKSRQASAGLVSSFLKDLPPHLVCPLVRLLVGELWPSWELREMGVGPISILKVLESICGPPVHHLSREFPDLGLLAEACLKQKQQNPLAREPLEALDVYQGLHKLSLQSGEHSRYRKEAILRGLLLEAAPLEGRYIVRTALRSMQAGLGPRLMAEALAGAFSATPDRIWDAYSRMPEMGMVAQAASQGALDEVKIVPGRPVKPMLFPLGDGPVETESAACLVRCRGLRAQVHVSQGRFWVFTSRLRDITPALAPLSGALLGLDHELIMDGELIGFKGKRLLSPSEMVRYINRKHLSRRSSVQPRLAIGDLLFQDGLDLTNRDYQDRRALLGGLFPAVASPEGLPSDDDPQVAIVRQVELPGQQPLQRRGFQIVVRSLRSPYLPGRMSRRDIILRGQRLEVRAAVIEARRGSGARREDFVSYRVALREGDHLVPVGWVSVEQNDQKALLDDRILKLAATEKGQRAFLPPPGPDGKFPVMEIHLDGLRREGKASLIRPRVVQIILEGSAAEVDALEKILGDAEPPCS
ncbi:MAG: hypothetical protein GKC10_05155 [Methanosarcinales archaeon]|nr:hypothetical protein [Methanosarcinales archaeon]